MCLGAGGEEISGVGNKIIMIHMLSIVFSELKSANKEAVANIYGVMMIAYKNTNLFQL